MKMGLLGIVKLVCIVCASLSLLSVHSIVAIRLKYSENSNVTQEKGKSAGNFEEVTVLETEETLKSWLRCVTPLVRIFRHGRYKRRAFDWNYENWPFDTRQRSFDAHEQTSEQYDGNETRIEDLHQLYPTEGPRKKNNSQVSTAKPEQRQPAVESSTKQPYLRQKAPNRLAYNRPPRPSPPPRNYVKHHHDSSPAQFSRNPYDTMAAVAYMLHQRENNRYHNHPSQQESEQHDCTAGCSESLLPLIALAGLGFLMIYLVGVAPGKRKKRTPLPTPSGIDGENTKSSVKYIIMILKIFSCGRCDGLFVVDIVGR